MSRNVFESRLYIAEKNYEYFFFWNVRTKLTMLNNSFIKIGVKPLLVRCHDGFIESRNRKT